MYGPEGIPPLKDPEPLINAFDPFTGMRYSQDQVVPHEAEVKAKANKKCSKKGGENCICEPNGLVKEVWLEVKNVIVWNPVLGLSWECHGSVDLLVVGRCKAKE
jgi:hypothetical protein